MSTDHLTTLLLLAIAVLLLLLGRWGRPRVTGRVRKGVWTALRCYPALNNRRAYWQLTASRDGLAAVLLLLNAAAKSHPELYEHKVPLLKAIVAASRDDEWWVEQHDHPQATDYQGTYVVFVETTIGPILADVPRVQLSAHISADDAASHFPDAPPRTGGAGRVSRSSLTQRRLRGRLFSARDLQHSCDSPADNVGGAIAFRTRG